MSSFKSVALNMYDMSVAQKISRGQQIADAIANNPGIFINPVPNITTLVGAVNDLDQAWKDAADGGKTAIALMHDAENILMMHLKLLAQYVEYVAKGNEQIIHLATFEVKHTPVKHTPEFKVFLSADDGAVGLRCKARKKTIYRWEYCINPTDNNWVLGGTTGTCSTFIGGLDSNVMYWFRVVLVSPTGESVLGPKAIVTN
jgi:hypothetical protein